MTHLYHRHNLFSRVCASLLIILHLLTFGSIRDVLAFSAQSQSYRLTSGAVSQGGSSRSISPAKLVLHCDSPSPFKDDASGYAATPFGNTQPDTSQSKFGGSSLRFDGNGDYLSIPDSDDWNFGAGDWTIDFWVRFNSLSQDMTFISQGGTDGNNAWVFNWYQGKLNFYFADSGMQRAYYEGTWSPAVNTWYHLALVRNGAGLTAYIDGAALSWTHITTTIGANTFGNISSPLNIGDAGYYGGYLNGWLDEFRITKGKALWTTDFTPPDAPYNKDTDTTASTKLTQDSLSDSCIGKAQAQSYNLTCGFIPALQTSPPVQTQIIPNQSWKENTAKPNAFNLDDYFSSELGRLTYTVSGNNQIKVEIASVSNPDSGLLLHCDNPSPFKDETGAHPVTPYGSAQSDSSQSKFGGSSLFFDGNADYLSIPDSDDWNFGAGDWTIDFWVRFNSLAQDMTFISQGTDGNNAWVFNWYQGKLNFYFADSGAQRAYYEWPWLPSPNTWYHLALARDEANLNVYVDGTALVPSRITTAIGANTLGNLSSPLNIGDVGYYGGYLNGWLDEFRITKGIARWTADFTPPASPYAIEAPSGSLVSFSQAEGFSGSEKIRFTAKDTEGNSLLSNEVTLQVEGADNPPVLDYIPDILAQETDLITIIPNATDLDGDAITYSFSSPLDSSGKWQTNYTSAGIYTVTVTAKDSTNLIDTQTVIINVRNVNRAPVLSPLADITVNEGDLVTVTPIVLDPDADAVTLYYSSPLDTSGKWLTNYDDAGVYPGTITASDGTDTVTQAFKITVNNTNRAPQASLSLSKYTVNPNETITITLSGSDPDGGTMSYVLKKDGLKIEDGQFTREEGGETRDEKTFTTSFSAIGDHNISATVTDSDGLSSTDTKGIDVVDPNANRDAINPVMGDFNGDALSDLGLHNSDTGTWEICLSDKGVFRNAVDWLNGFGTSKDWWPQGGDFNGDALTDIAVYNNTTGELKVALSSGAGFTNSGIWLTVPFASYSWQPFTANFNADKYTDFALYNKDTGEVRVALGKASGFAAFNSWIENFGTGYTALSGDFNGDSLSDLCLFNKTTGEVKAAFSNSKAFTDGSTWLNSYAQDKDLILSDFNNDGLTDIGYWDKTNSNWYYAASTGEKFTDKGLWHSGFGVSSDESVTTADFNADGLIDRAAFDRDQAGINRWTTQLSTNKPCDLLTEVDNGIGGKTKISYTYAASFDNPELPFPVYTASSISLVNTFPADRAASYSQSFNFSGGYFDAQEREFRGFSKVKVTDPITNNYTETYFYQGRPGQDGALKGQIEKIIAYDGNAREISQTQNTYEVKKSGPVERFLGFPGLIKQTTTVYEENAAYVTTEDSFTYDNIGNLLENRGGKIEDGELINPKTTQTLYAKAYTYNPSSAEGLNRPLETSLKDKDNAVISQKTFAYDNKGNLIIERIAYSVQRIEPTSQMINTQYAYDSFGNLTSTTNALGSTVTTDYESTFYTYPETVTNSLGHTVHYVYDARFGAVKSVTDPNGLTSESTYDSLGRLSAKRYTLYANPIVTYQYPDFNTKITTNAIGLSSTEYIDGLGRKYKAVSSGEDGANARLISSEVFYNNRGQTEKESLPHYADEAPDQISYIRYEYDIRGRLKKTVSDFPGVSKDAQSSIDYISPLYTETTDPRGNKKGTLKDMDANILEVTEFTQGGVYKTAYTYDIQNNLTQTTDSQGNITQIFYDSIGRKLKMIDPDMGDWTYEYDVLGNLLKQTDAKGQVISFDYDQLNRLTKKTRDEGGGRRDEVNYTYDDTSKDNCIGRLSKVTDQSGSTEFFYDKLGREIKSIKTITTPEVAEGLRGGEGGYSTYTVQREYDLLDRLTKLTYPDAEVVNYAYDVNSGLLEKVYSILNPQSSPIDYVKDISYNASGQIKTIQYGNGVTTDYTYGQDLRLSRIDTYGVAAGQLQDLNYIFDQNGNITTLTDNLRSNIRSFTYDDLDRLTRAENLPAPGGGWTNFDYQYDSIGNMTYKSDLGVLTYGRTTPAAAEGLRGGGAGHCPHALTSAAGYTYTYDANGNMTQGRSKALEYDAENRLTRVTEGATITEFTYDGDGGRVRKTRDDVGGTKDETTYIGSLYEERETTDEGRKTTKHIYAGSQRVCSITKDEARETEDVSYYHSDHLGSSNIITDRDGCLAQHYEYTPYGTTAVSEIVPHPSSLIPRPSVSHYFTGKELDSTGLYFYGARYYDPEIGRFITADTIVQSPYDPQSLNRYSYCRNNPINYIDPSGHFWFIPLIIAIAKAAVVGAVIGAGVAAATGGDIGRGALFGAISGAIFAGVSQLAQIAMKFAVTGTTQVSLIGGARATANIVSSVLGGAASGAAVAGMSGGDVGKSALVGGAIAGGISLMSETASYMRNQMIKQSRLDPRNSSGKSIGLKGDGFKLGGGRYDSVHPNGNPSPLGGKQGDVGQIFGMRYKPGDIWDRIVETYAGPHDYLNSWGYDMFGNLKNQTAFEGFLGATLNPLNVVIATPLAVSSIVPRAAYAAPAITYGLHQEDETR